MGYNSPFPHIILSVTILTPVEKLALLSYKFEVYTGRTLLYGFRYAKYCSGEHGENNPSILGWGVLCDEKHYVQY